METDSCTYRPRVRGTTVILFYIAYISFCKGMDPCVVNRGAVIILVRNHHISINVLFQSRRN